MAPMGLFKADFFRSFAIGFGLGAVVVFGVIGNTSNPVVPAAVAAPVE